MTALARTTMDTTLGPIELFATDAGLRAALLPGERAGRLAAEGEAVARTGHAVLDQAAEELTAYLAGELVEFTVPLDLAGSPFQLAVWAELTRIGYGETISYGELARRIGGTANPRAVGAANGRNTASIIVPCHRVIGADGALVGYAGGVETKATLLRHERAVVERRGMAVGELRLPV
jgi:methylated-DNA-[protein]-cysteine S-methyltransferase